MSADINCPKCKVQMKKINLNGAKTDECPKCGGIWVDNFEEKQVTAMKPEVFTMEDVENFRKNYTTQGKVEDVKYYKCPRCDNFMWRKNYMHYSGIVVDKCKNCGTFFDKGELEKAVEFIEKGGVEYEKTKTPQKELINTKHKLIREINRTERQMYRLHWIGRFLSIIGL